MATPEQIDSIINRIIQIGPHPPAPFHDVQDFHEGSRALMTILSKSDKPMSSRSVQKYFPVSAARIAVLVRSLENKGYLERMPDPQDGRSFLLVLTDEGKEFIEETKQKARDLTEQAIDAVGYKRMIDCLNTLEDLKTVFDGQIGSCQNATSLQNGHLCSKSGILNEEALSTDKSPRLRKDDLQK